MQNHQCCLFTELNSTFQITPGKDFASESAVLGAEEMYFPATMNEVNMLLIRTEKIIVIHRIAGS